MLRMQISALFVYSDHLIPLIGISLRNETRIVLGSISSILFIGGKRSGSAKCRVVQMAPGYFHYSNQQKPESIDPSNLSRDMIFTNVRRASLLPFGGQRAYTIGWTSPYVARAPDIYLHSLFRDTYLSSRSYTANISFPYVRWEKFKTCEFGRWQGWVISLYFYCLSSVRLKFTKIPSKTRQSPWKASPSFQRRRVYIDETCH